MRLCSLNRGGNNEDLVFGLDPDSSLSHIELVTSQMTGGAPIDPIGLVMTAAAFLLLLLSSAILSGSEVALFSLDGAALDGIRQAKDRSSKRVTFLLDQPRQVLVTILVLNTVVNVMAAIIAAVTTNRLARNAGWSPEITLAVEVIVVTFVLLIVSEITPKLLASRHPADFSRRVSVILLPLHRLLYPVSRSVAGLTARFQRSISTTSRPISGDDLKTMAEIGEAHGTIGGEERELIHSIVEFSETSVREVMVSRLDIVALPVTATLRDALELIRNEAHSRLPLYVDHLDNILGIIHAKDLLPYLSEGDQSRRLDWTRIARKPMFVPAGKKLDDLLADFQARRTHIAIVVDEYGGTAGLITLEDVLEQVVGDIRDENDETEEELIEAIEPDVYVCDGRLDLDDLNDKIGHVLETDDLDFETLGGLVFHLSGKVPEEGEKFSIENLELTVLEIDNRRIEKVSVRVLPTNPAGNDE